MQKIVLAIDALNINTKALDFACFLANLTHSGLTGIFLENTLSEAPVKEICHTSNAMIKTGDISRDELKSVCCEQNLNAVKEACEKRNVGYTIRRCRGIPSREVIKKSRFADLMIVDSETSFLPRYEGAPTKFVKDILESAECPVIIVPDNFEKIDKIIFTYDGSKSAVFAIKQFTYTLPQFCNKPAKVIEINEQPHDDSIKEKYELKEWLKAHYSNSEFSVLHGTSKYELVDYFLKTENAFIVMGAYSRNLFSSLFKSSHADLVIKTSNAPIFIAHY